MIKQLLKSKEEFDKKFDGEFSIVYDSPLGAACSYSEDWLILNPKSDSTRTGKIIGESRDKKCWWILWNGLRTKDCYSKKFIKRVDDIESRLKAFIEEQQLALIQEIKDWAEEKRLEKHEPWCEISLGEMSMTFQECRCGLFPHNKALEDLLKELDSIKEI